jgi:hypothetical protein
MKFSNSSGLRSVLLFFIILLALFMPANVMGALTSVSVTPNNSTVGEQSIYIVSFTTGAVWPANGKLTIEFPAGFNAGTVSLASPSSGVDGGLSATGSGTTATITRDGAGTAVGSSSSVTILIANVTNNTTTGSSYTATVTTQTSTGTDIESGVSSNFSLNPGALTYFTITGQPGSRTAGVSFDGVVVTAKDEHDNNKTDYNSSLLFYLFQSIEDI